MHVDILPEDVTALERVQLPAERTPALVYIAGMARSSRRVMHNGLAIAVAVLTVGADGWAPEVFPWWALRFAHTHALRAILREEYSASTGNRVLSAVRGVLKTAWRLDLMETAAYLRAVDVPSIPDSRPTQAAGRMLAQGEIGALLDVCAGDTTPAGVRDACVIGLAAYAGLRRQEIAGLQLDDLFPSVQAFYAAQGLRGGSAPALHVRGKRNKLRHVPLSLGLCAALADWLQLRGLGAGPLLVPVNKGGRLEEGGLSGQAVYEILERRRVQARVHPFTPHDLRRTFISELLDAGADIATVQKLVGHSSANTTAGYDRRGERAKADAVERLHMTWPRRFV